MNTQPVKIIDPHRNVVATAEVVGTGECFAGVIDLSAMPAALRKKFEEYEEIVNGQTFSLLDEIETEICHATLRVVLGDGSESCVEDLQIYPTTRRVSFKLRQETVRDTVCA